jgi:hypothetical protein
MSKTQVQSRRRVWALLQMLPRPGFQALGQVAMRRMQFSKWVVAALALSIITSPVRGLAEVPSAPPNPSGQNSDMVDHFMTTMPQSDQFVANRAEISSSRSPQILLQLMAQERFYSDQAAISAVRFYNGKKHDGKRMDRFTQDVRNSFAAECAAKGGKLESDGSDIYNRTLYGSRTRRGLRERVSPTTLDICMRTPRQSLGALIVQIDYTGQNFDGFNYAFATMRPSLVFSQIDIDREAAEDAALERRKQAARDQELAETRQWRRTIRAGTETGCGPVLSVNGDMVQLVHFRSREPKWYRRDELWPRERDVDGSPTCR